jgi:hypothetical protein
MINSYRFYAIAVAALLTNGMSLLGFADESAGGVARALECKSCLSRSSEIISAIELDGEMLISNTPPAGSLVAVALNQLGAKPRQSRQTPESPALPSARQ